MSTFLIDSRISSKATSAFGNKILALRIAGRGQLVVVVRKHAEDVAEEMNGAVERSV